MQKVKNERFVLAVSKNDRIVFILISIFLKRKLWTSYTFSVKGKGKAVPLQAWSGPQGSRKLR